MLTGLNHLTLSVADLDRSLRFYTELLPYAEMQFFSDEPS